MVLGAYYADLKIEEVISSQSYNVYSSFRPVCSLAADPVY